MSTPLAPIIHPTPVENPAIPKPTLDAKDKKKLKDAAVQLDATFNEFLMSEFNKGLPGSEGDFGSQVYADMFKQTIATKMAESSTSTGLTSEIYKMTEKSALAHGGSRPPLNQSPLSILPSSEADSKTLSAVTRDKSTMAYKALSATSIGTPSSL